jgi:hypothetical protein
MGMDGQKSQERQVLLAPAHPIKYIKEEKRRCHMPTRQLPASQPFIYSLLGRGFVGTQTAPNNRKKGTNVLITTERCALGLTMQAQCLPPSRRRLRVPEQIKRTKKSEVKCHPAAKTKCVRVATNEKQKRQN